MDPGAWYDDAVAKAAELGLMEGIGGGLFEPDRPVTRGELAAVAVRLYEKLKQVKRGLGRSKFTLTGAFLGSEGWSNGGCNRIKFF